MVGGGAGGFDYHCCCSCDACDGRDVECKDMSEKGRVRVSKEVIYRNVPTAKTK